MSESDQTRDGSERRPQKCPPRVKTEICQAIYLHIREHGRRDWHLVRERAEFAPWIGETAGESGRRKFYRWVEKARKPLQKDMTRPHEGREANEQQQAWAKVQAQSGAPEAPITISPRHLMANGSRALQGYAELGRLLADGIDEVDRLRQYALVADPSGPDGWSIANPELLLKLSSRRCVLVQTVSGLMREFNAIWAREEFNRAFLERLNEILSPHEALHEEVKTALQELLHLHGGVPPGAV